MPKKNTNLARSSSRTSRSKRSRTRAVSEEDSLLSSPERDHSTTPSYRSFPDHDSWSATSSTATQGHSKLRPEFNDDLPEDPILEPGFVSGAEDADESQKKPDDPGQGITRARGILIISTLAVLLILGAGNISLLTTTQGAIAFELNAFEYTTWFTSAFLASMSSTGPVYAKLSYIFKTRYILLGACIVSFLGALITSLTPSVAGFLAGRAVAGIGAAGVMCVVQVLVQWAPAKRRGLCQGLLNTAYTAGVASGAIVGGALQPAMGWRAMFWLQLPLIALAGTLLVFAIPTTIIGLRPRQADHELSNLDKIGRIDYLGAGLLIAALVSLLYGLASPQFDTASIVAIIVSVFVLTPLFVYQEAFRHDDPIIPVKVLKSEPVLFACLSTLIYMMSRWMVLFYTPIYATAVRGMHPAKAGSLLLPTNIGFALGGLITGQFHIRRDGSFYASCLAIFTVYPISLLAITFSTTQTVPMVFYWFLLLANGLCAGGAMNYTLAHLQHLVHVDVRLTAISIYFTFRGFAGTFGATVGGSIFYKSLGVALRTRFAKAHLKPSSDLLRQLIGSPSAVQDLTGVWKTTAAQAYVDALRTLFLAAVGMSILTFILQAFTGWKGPGEDEMCDSQQTIREEETLVGVPTE
ncbi:AP-3 complex subunit beta-2 [Venturia nashicola]|uniref:AP-3 complex subunit beta-2 n=1 Tax=Venturia nashicola TaxID=86259 RepID=A0A4Z1PSK0_9PEZI|nr:AP-3 complex subunit beta-2 [Venturia nashicola]TLD37896.1 AP-3 complex subunit beta-2 [Venturia nashicola]